MSAALLKRRIDALRFRFGTWRRQVRRRYFTPVRRLVEASGRDLVAEFRALLPPHQRIRGQRWSLRRVLLPAQTSATGARAARRAAAIQSRCT